MRSPPIPLRGRLAAGLLLAGAAAASGAVSPPRTSEALQGLAGTWAGTLVHGRDSARVALTIVPADSGRCVLQLSMPVIHLDHVPIGRVRPEVRGDSVRLGPFTFLVDLRGGRLSGIVPAGLVPVHRLPLVLDRVEHFEAPARRPLEAPERAPRWRFDAGAAVWAGPAIAEDRVFVGTAAGDIHAIDADRGARLWTYRTGGAVRVRPLIADGRLYAQADDGALYCLDARSGTLLWRVPLVATPIVRLPFSDPGSRFDRFGSDVVLADGRLHVGTHDGRLVALDPASGKTLWSFESGDAVLAAPAVHEGRVLFGSFDRHVYALDAADGTLLWKRDVAGAVVSTPAVAGGVAVIGTRAYDLLGLDVRTGEERWRRYIWMSWVESSARIDVGIAYVGSSDAAAVYAFDAASGAPRWKTDVHGWAWGQPAVRRGRVYTGTSSQAGYLAAHRAGVVAMDAERGTPVWRYTAAIADTGAFGFPGSIAAGERAVYAAGLDGGVYAFDP